MNGTTPASDTRAPLGPSSSRPSSGAAVVSKTLNGMVTSQDRAEAMFGGRDARGNVVRVFAAAHDVTARKEASKYARSLIEASLGRAQACRSRRGTS